VEQSLIRLRLLWDLLRVILVGLVAATSLLILSALPTAWWIATFPIFILDVIAAILAVTQWRMVWVWLALLAQAFLFALALFAAVFGAISGAYVPALLLAFTMILASEHVLGRGLTYSSQFSRRGNTMIWEFNADALNATLSRLYKQLARDGLILGVGFALSIIVASLGALGPVVSVLSDPSLYMVIASISLAALVALKEE
jgi:hypothetical protein